MMCGIKSLYTVKGDNMCDQYNCKYPIRYWELESLNARESSSKLIVNSVKLMEKVQIVSNKKDAIVFSGIVPICYQSIFLSDIMKHAKRSPYHQIPTDESLLHQLDIAGWKAIIGYNEWANIMTSKLELQWNIEEEFFTSSQDKRKLFLKSKTLNRDGYYLLGTAVSLRKEKLVIAVKNCFTMMGIENCMDMQKIENNESKKNRNNSSKLKKESSETSNEIKKTESKANKEGNLVCEITENQDYFLDTEGNTGTQKKKISKEPAVTYLNIVLVCDERDENLQNMMLHPGTEIIFKKGLGMHDAFIEMKNHHLFGKGTLFIMLCGIQTAFSINYRNQVQILGGNPTAITKHLIMKAKQLQENVLKTSRGSDNVIFTGMVPVDYMSMGRMSKRDLLIACLKYNEWASSQALELKCSHWDIVKYWFMLSNEVDNDLKLVLKEDIIVQDKLCFTQQAKMYRNNVIMKAVAKTWELLKAQDLRRILNKNNEHSSEKEDLRIMLNRRKDQIEDQLKNIDLRNTLNNKNDLIKSNNITSETHDPQVAAHGDPVKTSNIPFEKVVIVGNIYNKSLLKKLARDIPKMEILADTVCKFQQDFTALIEYIEKHKYIGQHNTLWILTSDISWIAQRLHHSSCQYYGCRDPISFLSIDLERYINGEDEARNFMRNEAQRIAKCGRRFRDKINKLFDDSCAVVLCPPLPATVYISPYPLTVVNYDHQLLHSALSSFLNFEDVDIIEQPFLEPLIQFYSNFSMEWLNFACDILQEENMCYSNLVEYKVIQGNCIQVLSSSMNYEPYWIKIVSDIICSALTKPHIRKTAPIPSADMKAPISVQLEFIDKQNDIPVVNSEKRMLTVDASHSEIPITPDKIDDQQEKIRHFQSIILIGTQKFSKVLKEHVKDNIKFVEGKLNFDEKSDEFILCQQNNFQGETLWVCLVDFLRLTCTVNASMCENDRYCSNPLRISKLNDNENEFVKAEHFISRMIPKINKGSAIMFAPLAPSQVVLESHFKYHAHIHSFCDKSKVPIITGDKENLMKNFDEYEKKWLTMIHSVCCCQKLLGSYEIALNEYGKNKGSLVDIIESQYLHHKALVEWVEFMDALFIHYKELTVREVTENLRDESLDCSRIMENELCSSVHETISESDLPNRSNAVPVSTNSLLTTATSNEINKISKGATCITPSSEEGIITEKLVNANLTETSKSKIAKQNKDIETFKILDIKRDKKCLENSSIKNTNESILEKTKELECAKKGLGKNSKVITKVLSQNSDLLSPSVVSEEALTDTIDNITHTNSPSNSINVNTSAKKNVTQINDAKNKLEKEDREGNCKQLNILKPKSDDVTMPLTSKKVNAVSVPAEGITSTSNDKDSEMHYSIHDITNEGKLNADKKVFQKENSKFEVQQSLDKTQTVTNELNTSKILLKTVEPSDFHKNSSTKLCAEYTKKDNNKECELSDKTKPVTIPSQDNSIVETIDTCTKKVCLSEIPESLTDEVFKELLKACGPIKSFKRNIEKGPAEALCGDSITAARVARLFNQRTVNNKTLHAWLPKDGSSVNESLPKLTDIEESLKDKEATKKIKEILDKQNYFPPPKFQPRSLQLSGSISTASEKKITSTPAASVTSRHVISSKDSVFTGVDNSASNDNVPEIKCSKDNTVKRSSKTNITNDDIRNSGIKKIGKYIDKKYLSENSNENKNKDARLVNKDDQNINSIKADKASGNCSTNNQSKTLLKSKEYDEDRKKKSRESISYKRNKEVNSNETVSSDISSCQDFETELLHVKKKVEKRKRNSSENQDNNICMNQQAAESSAETKRSSLHESEFNDCKRSSSRSRSRSPYKRHRRKSSESQTKEKESISRNSSFKPDSSAVVSSTSSNSNFSAPVSSTVLGSNIPESASVTSSSSTSHCEANFEDDPILNGLPDGFRSQLDDVQWKEFVSKLTTQYNCHRTEYDEYHHNPELHDEYDKKRDSFMEMLEKQKSNATHQEKNHLWNQFWKVELKKTDEEKWKQWKNRLIKLTLKKAQKNVDLNPVENNPSSFRNCSNKASDKNVDSKGISFIDLEETVQIKKEPMDIVDTQKNKVKEENLDPPENIATRVKVENNVKIEDNMQLGTSIKKETSVDFDMSIPLNFGSDDQVDPESFVNDLDKLCTEYVAVGVGQDDSGPSNSSRGIINPEFHGSPTSSARMRSPEFQFGEPQEFNLKKERNVSEDYSTIEKQFDVSKGDPYFNVNTRQCMVMDKSDFPHHQTDNTTTESTALDINPKEKQSETSQANFKVKDALHTIQSLSNRLPLLGPLLSNFINKIKSQPTDSVKELELLQEKHFLLLLGAAAAAFEKESERIDDQIVKCLLEVGRKQALDLIEYAKSKQTICIHGVNIENIAQRTLYKTAKECRQFIETAIMYESNSSIKPSEDLVKEVFNKVSMLHYNMIKERENKGNRQ